MTNSIISDNSPRPQLSFQYGEEQIAFERSARANPARILIKVLPDGCVTVKAPLCASDDDVIHAVKKKARWICQQRKCFQEQSAWITPRRYVSGESHYYLGRQHLLKVIIDSTQNQQVKLLRGRLQVITQNNAPAHIKKLLHRWYSDHARIVFNRRLNLLIKQILWLDAAPSFQVQTMKTQWGSCSAKGRLTLNVHLVKAPTDCIDYVLLHELCHLAEHNHSPRFYHLMTQVMPHWQQVKTRLDNMASKLLNM